MESLINNHIIVPGERDSLVHEVTCYDIIGDINIVDEYYDKDGLVSDYNLEAKINNIKKQIFNNPHETNKNKNDIDHEK